MQPDLHTPGSPLPTSYYYADVGDLSVRDPETKLPGAPRSRVSLRVSNLPLLGRPSTSVQQTRYVYPGHNFYCTYYWYLLV